MAEAFSMMGEAHERTIITRERTVKNLYSSSGFSAIRTRSEERLKIVNGELARTIEKFNAHLSIFLWKKRQHRGRLRFSATIRGRLPGLRGFPGKEHLDSYHFMSRQPREAHSKL